MRKFTTIAIALFALSGCMSTGNEQIRDATEATVKTQIRKGVSTKADVKEAYGSPATVSFTDSGNEIWNYTHSVANNQAVNFVPVVNSFTRRFDVDTKQLIIYFNKAGVVQSYTMNESRSELRQGIGAN